MIGIETKYREISAQNIIKTKQPHLHQTRLLSLPLIDLTPIFSVFTIHGFVDHRWLYHFHCMPSPFRYYTSKSTFSRTKVESLNLIQFPLVSLPQQNHTKPSSDGKPGRVRWTRLMRFLDYARNDREALKPLQQAQGPCQAGTRDRARGG